MNYREPGKVIGKEHEPTECFLIGCWHASCWLSPRQTGSAVNQLPLHVIIPVNARPHPLKLGGRLTQAVTAPPFSAKVRLSKVRIHWAARMRASCSHRSPYGNVWMTRSQQRPGRRSSDTGEVSESKVSRLCKGSVSAPWHSSAGTRT